MDARPGPGFVLFEAQNEPIAQFDLIRGELRHAGGIFSSGGSDLASNFLLDCRSP